MVRFSIVTSPGRRTGRRTRCLRSIVSSGAVDRQVDAGVRSTARPMAVSPMPSAKRIVYCPGVVSPSSAVISASSSPCVPTTAVLRSTRRGRAGGQHAALPVAADGVRRRAEPEIRQGLDDHGAGHRQDRRGERGHSPRLGGEAGQIDRVAESEIEDRLVKTPPLVRAGRCAASSRFPRKLSSRCPPKPSRQFERARVDRHAAGEAVLRVEDQRPGAVERQAARAAGAGDEAGLVGDGSAQCFVVPARG